MSEMFMVNTGRKRRRSRRRKHRARAHNPGPKHRRRRRRHYHHNPSLFGARLDFAAIGWGVVGAVGTELGAAAASKLLPASMQASTPAKLAVKAGVVVLGGFVARKALGPSTSRALIIGGGIAVGVELVRDYLLPLIPGAQGLMADYSLSDYRLSGSELSGLGEPSATGIRARWPANWEGTR